MGVLVLTIGLALPLAACSGAAGINFRNTKPQLVAEPDSTSLMIADAADRATRALESLAAVEQTRTPGVAAAAAMVPNAPVELQRAVTFQWSGPVEDVTRDMAARAGYSFSTVGDLPPTPIIVNLNAYNEPLIEVFRDIGLQMGTRADLKLDASRHTVDILYTPTVNRVMPNSSSTSEVTLHRKRPSR
ncbi:MAG: DotD/TraH family lipoprotein [Rhodospirillales bacterium]|nr:DotD/TraH family lipoprotein [Alphaproteobacteria bacterium]MCB9986573.1 DotD/TraH family lipoprotein [Rhodospirillales bacterium]USO06895.1 MAG: DotD/TraH family lipoprotein [Rhodospirillales bacterium]